MSSQPRSIGIDMEVRSVHILPPMRSRASSTRTDFPARRISAAADNPLTPAPMTITSQTRRSANSSASRADARGPFTRTVPARSEEARKVRRSSPFIMPLPKPAARATTRSGRSRRLTAPLVPLPAAQSFPFRGRKRLCLSLPARCRFGAEAHFVAPAPTPAPDLAPSLSAPRRVGRGHARRMTRCADQKRSKHHDKTDHQARPT